MNDFVTRARNALERITANAEEGRHINGLLGRLNSDGSTTFTPMGLRNHKYVRIRNSSGSQTTIVARDDTGVAESSGLAVRLRVIHSVPNSGVVQYAIVGIVRDDALATMPAPPPGGVPPHIHDERYYREDEHINVSVGAADAGKPVVLDAGGKLDASFIDSEDIADIVGAMVTGNTETDIAVTYQDADNTLDFVVSSTLVADRIAAAATDDTIQDADLWGYLTGGVLVKTAWSNIKAVLKTYFDTLYVALTGDQTIAGAKTFSSGIISSGNSSSLRLVDPDVAHGMTAIVPTDVYGSLEVISGTVGGAQLIGLTDADGVALTLRAVSGAATPTVAAIRLTGSKKSGTGNAVIADSEIVFVVENLTTRLLTGYGDGKASFEGLIEIKNGKPLYLTDPDVAHGMTDLLPTNVWGGYTIADAAAGGVSFFGMSDGDIGGLFLNGIIGTASPTSVTCAMTMVGAKKSGTFIQALAAGEKLFTLINNAATVLTIFGDGDMEMVSGSALSAETIKAVDASGISIYDDGGNLAIFVKDGGNVGLAGTNNPQAKVHIKLDDGQTFGGFQIEPKAHDAVTPHTISAPYAAGFRMSGGSLVGDSHDRAAILWDQTGVDFLTGSGSVAATSKSKLSNGGIWNFGFKRNTAQFDKTNTTLATVTGMSVNVEAGKTYKFSAVLHITASAGGGHKVAIGGTATATAIVYQVMSMNNGTGAYVITSRQTAMGGAAGQTGATTVYCVIEGMVTVNAAGTLLVQFAQNAASGTSSVLVGSNFEVVELT